MKNEINLLPRLVQHARMTRIYNQRLHRLVNSVLAALLLIVLGQAASIFVVKESLARTVSKTVVADSQDTQRMQQVAADNQLIAEVKRRAVGQALWSDNLESILAIVPENFSILELQADSPTRKLTITASSASRVANIDYEKALRALPWVQTVDAPLQNFALSDKNQFTFFVYGKENAL